MSRLHNSDGEQSVLIIIYGCFRVLQIKLFRNHRRKILKEKKEKSEFEESASGYRNSHIRLWRNLSVIEAWIFEIWKNICQSRGRQIICYIYLHKTRFFSTKSWQILKTYTSPTGVWEHFQIHLHAGNWFLQKKLVSCSWCWIQWETCSGFWWDLD